MEQGWTLFSTLVRYNLLQDWGLSIYDSQSSNSSPPSLGTRKNLAPPLPSTKKILPPPLGPRKNSIFRLQCPPLYGYASPTLLCVWRYLVLWWQPLLGQFPSWSVASKSYLIPSICCIKTLSLHSLGIRVCLIPGSGWLSKYHHHNIHSRCNEEPFKGCSL